MVIGVPIEKINTQDTYILLELHSNEFHSGYTLRYILERTGEVRWLRFKILDNIDPHDPIHGVVHTHKYEANTSKDKDAYGRFWILRYAI
jgi:hypothetical protein